MEDGDALLIGEGMVATIHQHCACVGWAFLSKSDEEKYNAAVEFDDTNG
jgi:hypothetical protein